MNAPRVLRLQAPAHDRSVAPMRRALRSFLEKLGLDRGTLDDVTTAAGEALANAVEHAYGKGATGVCNVELLARMNSDHLALEISDRGSFRERAPLPGRGFGLRIIHAVAADVAIEKNGGTRIRMRFRTRR